MPNYLRWMEQAGFTGVDCAWKQFSLAVVYGELRRLAAVAPRRERPGHTLQETLESGGPHA